MRVPPLLLMLTAVACAPAAEISYAKQIQPILSDRCYSCHGPEKQKSDLRLDSPSAILKGGKKGLVLVAGNVAKSPLYASTILPKGDDDIMPAKGEPLTQAQTELIRDWILAGAKFDEAAAPGVAAAGSAPVAPVAPLGPTTIDVASASLPTPDAASVKALTEAGAVIAALSSNGKALDIDLSHTNEPFGDKHLQLLERVAANVLWLNLRGATVGDAQLKVLAKCRSLTRLHLDRTAVTNAGLAQLKGCPHLEYLNLVGTKVGDAGLAQLGALSELKSLYVWQSAATPDGIAQLEKALPNLDITSAPEFSTAQESEGKGKKRKKN
jgi:hypothetical protein